MNISSSSKQQEIYVRRKARDAPAMVLPACFYIDHCPHASILITALYASILITALHASILITATCFYIDHCNMLLY
jgi:hypothetical protein